eukprot:scaffold253161_cov23-Tisochrysis_lutea.AAC.7
MVLCEFFISSASRWFLSSTYSARSEGGSETSAACSRHGISSISATFCRTKRSRKLCAIAWRVACQAGVCTSLKYWKRSSADCSLRSALESSDASAEPSRRPSHWAVSATAAKPDTSGVPESTQREAALTPCTMATWSRSLL